MNVKPGIFFSHSGVNETCVLLVPFFFFAAVIVSFVKHNLSKTPSVIELQGYFSAVTRHESENMNY